MGVYGHDATMNIEIMNCSFSNCVSQALYGEAQGMHVSSAIIGSAFINPVIKNCVFQNTGNGCVIKISGSPAQSGWYPRYGYATPTIIGNIFTDLSGTAFLMAVDSYAAKGTPIFINNTVVNSRVGIDTIEPWDASPECRITFWLERQMR